MTDVFDLAHAKIVKQRVCRVVVTVLQHFSQQVLEGDFPPVIGFFISPAPADAVLESDARKKRQFILIDHISSRVQDGDIDHH